MRTGEAVPRIKPEASFAQALIEITRKRMGMVAVVDAARHEWHLTDGDLGELFAGLDGSTERVAVDFARLRVDELMTPGPARIRSDALAAEAVRLMEERKIGQLLVADADDRLVGAINFHDLLTARVV